jgi:hypothetical protein
MNVHLSVMATTVYNHVVATTAVNMVKATTVHNHVVATTAVNIVKATTVHSIA